MSGLFYRDLSSPHTWGINKVCTTKGSHTCSTTLESVLNLKFRLGIQTRSPNLSQFRQSANVCQKGWDGRAHVRSALKRTLVLDFNYFAIMFNYIFSTTYQKIGDLFCSLIFLDISSVQNPNCLATLQNIFHPSYCRVTSINAFL
jgi:hypothetical protein